MSPNLQIKIDRLRGILLDMDHVLVAYSGGVDSAFLLKVAVETLGDRAVALTARSESYPEWELTAARQLATQIGARLIEVETHEMDRAGYRKNAGDRCYYCKTELFEVAAAHASRLDLGQICYGAITDDLGDHRPGMVAAEERAARAPLIEAGLSKAEIRTASRAMGLPTWDKPASACLSSRFPYGTEITPARLQRVAQAEAGIQALGLRQFRVRFHGDLARIEIEPTELEQIFLNQALRQALVQICKDAGFLYVSLDLEGYRSGSANAALVQIG